MPKLNNNHTVALSPLNIGDVYEAIVWQAIKRCELKLPRTQKFEIVTAAKSSSIDLTSGEPEMSASLEVAYPSGEALLRQQLEHMSAMREAVTDILGLVSIGARGLSQVDAKVGEHGGYSRYRTVDAESWSIPLEVSGRVQEALNIMDGSFEYSDLALSFVQRSPL